MSVSLVTQASGLSAGSELWVIPPIAHSKWARRLNWYLNFLLTKAELRKKPELAWPLRMVLNDTDLQDLEAIVPKTHSDLLVASQNYLPNTWVLVLSDWSNPQLLCDQTVQNLINLRLQTVRFFMPSSFSGSHFMEIWQKNKDVHSFDAQLVLELTT